MKSATERAQALVAAADAKAAAAMRHGVDYQIAFREALREAIAAFAQAEIEAERVRCARAAYEGVPRTEYKPNTSQAIAYEQGRHDADVAVRSHHIRSRTTTGGERDA